MLIFVKLLFPALIFAALALDMPAKAPAYWFSASACALLAYFIIARFRKDRLMTMLSLMLGGLFLAGVIGYTGYRWLHVIYIPYIVFVSAFFGLDSLIAVALATPLFEIRHLLFSGAIHEELSLAAVVAVSGATSHFFLLRLKREKERLSASLKSLKDVAMDSLSGESLLARSMSLSMEADSEISDVLNAAMHTIGPDSVSLFTAMGGELGLRRSTDNSVSVSEKGLIQISYERKEAIVIGNSELKTYNPGYARKGRTVSIICVPVMDSSFALGVLAADSAKPDAFGDSDVKGLQMFARLMTGILKKHRIYAEMERSQLGMKVLHEESARLVTSLKPETVTTEVVEGAHRIAPLGIALFVKDGRGFHLAKSLGLRHEPPKDKLPFSINDTLIEPAVKRKENTYIPDMKGYSVPALPFNAGKVASAFIMPLYYEAEVIGALAVVSDQTDPLTPYQMELLDVFGNQASSSLKNAMLHANIERMATTDGLTGLFNHRQFQERLSQEFIRLQRVQSQLSLLLIDIDHFKKVNDTYGHPAGDSVLRSVAAIIRKTVREADMPARYGGEEFAALLIGTDKKGALLMAERLRTAVEEAVFQADGKRLRAAVSIGIASAPVDASTKEQLVERADTALYKAKQSGRNRSVIWTVDMADKSK